MSETTPPTLSGATPEATSEATPDPALTGMSKSALKKLAKQKAKEERKKALAAKMKAEGKTKAPSKGTTPEENYQSRLQLANEWRKQFAIFYGPPMTATHTDWVNLYKDAFKDMKLETDKDRQKGVIDKTKTVSISGRVTSIRAAGKMGFLTVKLSPRPIHDYDYNESVDVCESTSQVGYMVTPEVQIMIRPQELELATVKTIRENITQPQKYHIEAVSFENDEEREMATVQFIKDFCNNNCRVLDQYHFIGHAGLSRTGERSIYVKHVFPVSINHFITNSIHGAEEHGIQHFSHSDVVLRNPYMRWLYHSDAVHTQLVRSRFNELLHNKLRHMGLTSLDIPHLVSVSSGANAKPFKTHQHDHKMDLQLRIAPELELKMFVIGAMKGCYCIGAQFRNEGMDSTHNPEFTSCEFYLPDVDFSGLVKESISVISSVACNTLSSSRIITMEEFTEMTSHSDMYRERPFLSKSVFTKEDGTSFEIDWSCSNYDDIQWPFIDFMKGLNDALDEGYKLEDATIFETESGVARVREVATHHQVDFKETDSVAKILDNMFDHLVIPLTFQREYMERSGLFQNTNAKGQLQIRPVVVYGHPKVMSPLAMEVLDDSGQPTGIVYRYEIFVAGIEIGNGYQELSDPRVQEANFQSQRKFQDKGDEEAMTQNDSFLKGLEYGMTPVAGFGMGLERMYMLLTNHWNIKDVLPFPLVKPHAHEASEVIETS